MSSDLLSKEGIEARFRQFLGDEEDQSREAKKKRRILAAAYALFLTQGYRKTTVDDVAQRAEVAKGTVYLYFKGKSDLLLHAIAFEKKALKAELLRLVSDETPERDRLKGFLRLTLVAVRDLPLVARLTRGDAEFMDALAEVDPAMVEQNREDGRAFMGQLIEWAAPGVLDDAERALRADVLSSLGFLSTMLQDPRVRGNRSLDEFIEGFVRILAKGVIAPRDPQ